MKKKEARTRSAGDWVKKLSVEDNKKIFATMTAESVASEKDSASVMKKKEALAAALKTYSDERKYQRYQPSKKDDSGSTWTTSMIERRLTLGELPGLLKATNYTYKDLFEIVTAEKAPGRSPIEWYSEDAKRFAQICDARSEKERQFILKTVTSLVPKPLREMNAEEDQPLSRAVRVMLARQVNMGDSFAEIKKSKDDPNLFYRLYKRNDNSPKNRNYKFGSLSEFYDFAKIGQLSLHYVMGMDETQLILAKNGTTELIMDAFCLLPTRLQHAIADGLAAV